MNRDELFGLHMIVVFCRLNGNIFNSFLWFNSLIFSFFYQLLLNLMFFIRQICNSWNNLKTIWYYNFLPMFIQFGSFVFYFFQMGNSFRILESICESHSNSKRGHTYLGLVSGLKSFLRLYRTTIVQVSRKHRSSLFFLIRRFSLYTILKSIHCIKFTFYIHLTFSWACHFNLLRFCNCFKLAFHDMDKSVLYLSL